MTGELIRFERRRSARRDLLLQQQQPVPRAPETHRSGIIELRVVRIARLLTELEELTRPTRDTPLTTLDRARAGLERARRIVCPSTAVADDLGGAPQPVLDDERIERMYRELNQDV
jgi:hypothetical protein